MGAPVERRQDQELYRRAYVRVTFSRAGIDWRMMEEMLRRFAHLKVYLTKVPGKEGFYEKLGFLRQTNAMGHFAGDAKREAIGLGVLVE